MKLFVSVLACIAAVFLFAAAVENTLEDLAYDRAHAACVAYAIQNVPEALPETWCQP